MSVALVYDDTAIPPSSLNGVIGASRFGEVVFRRQRLQEGARALVQAVGLQTFFVQTREDDGLAFAQQIRESGVSHVLHLPAYLPAADIETAKARLQRMLLSPDPCQGGLASQPTSLFAAPLGRYLENLVASGGLLDPDQWGPSVTLDGAFVDIRDPSTLVDYLSGAFTSRHFNHVARQNGVVVKASADGGKIQREHDFYYFLPPDMQRWFVQPYGLSHEGASASYRMERLLVLDAAQQWVNGALSPADFELLLADVFSFIDARPQQVLTAAAAQQESDRLYIHKVEQRLEALRRQPVWGALSGLFDQVSGRTVEGLYDAYFALARTRSPAPNLCVGHGDLCLSNILYDRRLRLLKLIDPRGADTAAAIFMDPLYDLAKLSHSVLGGYDFIVNGLYDLMLDGDLKLKVFTPEPDFAAYARPFIAGLEQRGYDVRQVRLAEASLFLSMLPLHKDNPRNMLAFLLIAANIIDEIAP